MNYFGLFFTFMLPGIVLGALAVLSHREMAAARRKKAARCRRMAGRAARPASNRPRQGLYVADISAPAEGRAA